MRERRSGKEMAARAFGVLLLAFAVSLGLFPVPLAPGESPPDPAADPHSHFRNSESCPQCHVYRESGPDPKRFVTGADAFCLDCHSREGLGVTHPRNIRPADKAYGMRVPDDLPLDAEGRIFCLTCHSAHGPFLAPTRAYAAQMPEQPGVSSGAKPAYRTYFARRPDPERGFVALCEGCHGRQ